MMKFYFRYGAMNFGKSATLPQAVYSHEERGQRILLTKPAVDTGGDTAVVSRLEVSHNVDLLVNKKTSPRGLLGSLVAEAEAQGEGPVACLLIDEAQFPNPAQANDLLRIAVKLVIPVIAYGICTDFLTHSFPGSCRPLEIARSLEELETIYRCGRKAMLNGRTIDGTFVFSEEQVTVDGVEIDYRALCPARYFEAGGPPPYGAECHHGGMY